jgi:Fe-S-cluster containining protein
MTIRKPAEPDKGNTDELKIIRFVIDVFGRPEHFEISVAERQARLPDIVPLARNLSTELAITVLKRLRSSGESVSCRKGCCACCNYLVPLSIPEAFRLREEILALPDDRSSAVLKSLLETAKVILDKKPDEAGVTQSSETAGQTQLQRLSKWYSSLELACPFLSGSVCGFYEHRPVACREHMATGPASLCRAERPAADAPKLQSRLSDEQKTVPMPVSVLECLGQLTAELEQSDIEAVMLPLALPWVQGDFERGERMWSAVAMVECFVEILQKNCSERQQTLTLQSSALS